MNSMERHNQHEINWLMYERKKVSDRLWDEYLEALSKRAPISVIDAVKFFLLKPGKPRMILPTDGTRFIYPSSEEEVGDGLW